MGQGGYLAVINGTPYNWILKQRSSYKMTHWDDTFDSVTTIHSNESVHLYLEFGGTEDNAGEATYQMDGTDFTFTIYAKFLDKLTFFAILQFPTQLAATGEGVSIGFNVNSDATFIIAGDGPDTFVTNGKTASNWMQSNLKILGARNLQQLCMPASHDAGMSTITVTSGVANAANTLTQYSPVADQLTAGARFFDIRPLLNNQVYATGHFSPVLGGVLGFVGLGGQTIQSIVDDINSFLVNNHELVILNLWASLSLDATPDQPFSQAEYDGLYALLTNPTTGLRNLYIDKDPTNVDLRKLPLSTFIGNGHGAVVVLVQPWEISIGSYADKGLYKGHQLRIHSDYSNTTDFAFMRDDQFTKMKNFCASKVIDDRELFVLSWGMTLSGLGNLIGDIRQNADVANLGLWMVAPQISKTVYPNLISIDSIRDAILPALVMAINWMTK